MSVAPTDRAPRPAISRELRCQVLVIGSGPSGAATAYWLAEAGYDVIAIDKKHFPREKTCGDGLTPRSVRQLADMGLSDELATHHHFDGLRAIGFGKELLLDWPEHPDFGRIGYVITRAELDSLVAERARKVGAQVLLGIEATGPLHEGAAQTGLMGGAIVHDHDHGVDAQITADFVVIADGANSRIGRALGTTRDRSVPLGMAIRGYFASPRHDERYIESHLDIRDESGAVMPGYGWIFPVGDGRVNVGVGLLSSFDHWKSVNTTRLLDAFIAQAPESWEISPATACSAPTGGRLPMGFSVGPRSGRDYLIVGDAAGSINPFNGEGIAYGYETGRIAASFIGGALTGHDAGVLSGYDAHLEEHYGLYYRIASHFMTLMGRPAMMQRLVGTGMYSKSVMEWVLRIMGNLLRPEDIGPAEAAYRFVAALATRRDDSAVSV